MNGRIYDPLIGRFLSADIAIQSPLNLQSYNRYSYVMNNPLTMTDPTGWFFMEMLPDWMQTTLRVTGSPAVTADGMIDHTIITAKEAGAVYRLGTEHGDGIVTSGATAGAVGLTRFVGAMDWAEAVHGEKIVVSNGSASTTAITSPGEVAAKAVGGAAGMVLTGVGGAEAIGSKLEAAAPKAGVDSTVNPSTAPTTEAQKLGGAYGDVKGVPGNEAHHMPADSVSPISTEKGPAITMSKEDHQLTASWGNSKEAQAYRADQQALIAKGDFKGAQGMDIKDVRGKFGDTYDKHIQQLEDYTKNLKKPDPDK